MRSIIFVSICAAFAGGCSFERPQQRNGLTIVLQDGAAGVLSTPTSASGFNCFMVNVTGQGVARDVRIPGSCASTDNMRGRGFGVTSRFVPRGTSIELDLPAGANRTIDVYGVDPPAAECGGSSVDVTGASGFFLGSTVADLTQSLTLTIPISFASGASSSFKCGTTATSSPANTFGTGSDGNVTITSVVADSSVDTSILGRSFAAARRVSSVDNATGTVLAFSSAITATDYQAGEEIIWMVMAANTDTSCDTGGSLYRGKWGTATIASVSVGGSTITLSSPIISSPGTISNSSLSGTLGTAPFCALQVVRVPNFDNLTISNGANLAVNAPAFTYGNGVGGLLAMRVKTLLTLTGGGSHSIQASNKGFAGGTSPGNAGAGVAATGPSGLSPNLNGGGGGTGGPARGGGGGSNQVVGGDGGNNTGSAGVALSCNGAASSDCSLMGGGGGGSGNAGGAGGGIVMLFAKQISGNLVLKADGEGVTSSATQPGGGGGGGGVAILKSSTLSGSVTLSASGGAGASGSTSAGGGGGSGGQASASYCSGTAPTALATGASGGSNSTPGSAGANGTASVAQSTAFDFCQ